MNISSLIVDVRAGQLAAVRGALSGWSGVEVPAASAQGRLIVTVESPNDTDTTETIARIGALDGVLSVALVYHQIEPNPDMEVRDDADAT